MSGERMAAGTMEEADEVPDAERRMRGKGDGIET